MTDVDWIIAGPWLLWAVSWMTFACSTRPSAQSEAALSRLIHLGLLAVASALFILPAFRIHFLGQQLLPNHPLTLVIGVIGEVGLSVRN